LFLPPDMKCSENVLTAKSATHAVQVGTVGIVPTSNAAR
jgi:hypothetical protein